MYELRPMTPADLPLATRWLEMPHVSEWRGAPDEQLELLSGDLAHPAMEQYIVAIPGRDFPCVPSDRTAEWTIGFGSQPDNTRGNDQMIEPDMVERGHGSAFIRSFIERLLAASVPRVVTDPDPTNARAIRCYENAGFAGDRLVDTPDGTALLMVRNARSS